MLVPFGGIDGDSAAHQLAVLVEAGTEDQEHRRVVRQAGEPHRLWGHGPPRACCRVPQNISRRLVYTYPEVVEPLHASHRLGWLGLDG